MNAATHKRTRRKKVSPIAPIKPIAVRYEGAAKACGFSIKKLRQKDAAKLCPAPIRDGGMVLWLVSDLELWLGLGMPNRAVFEREKAARANPKH